MQKGFGIAALIIAILAMFTPMLGTWLTVLVALLAVFAYGDGLGLGTASIIVNIFHILFFSPLLWTTQGILGLGASQSGHDIIFVPWLLIGVQTVAFVAAILLHRRAVSSQSLVAEPANH